MSVHTRFTAEEVAGVAVTLVGANGATPGSVIVAPPAPPAAPPADDDEDGDGPPERPPVPAVNDRMSLGTRSEGVASTDEPTPIDARSSGSLPRPSPRVTLVNTFPITSRAWGLADAVPANASAATSVTPTSRRLPDDRDGCRAAAIRG